MNDKSVFVFDAADFFLHFVLELGVFALELFVQPLFAGCAGILGVRGAGIVLGNENDGADA